MFSSGANYNICVGRTSAAIFGMIDPAGLDNLGTTCYTYLNALLQSLF